MTRTEPRQSYNWLTKFALMALMTVIALWTPRPVGATTPRRRSRRTVRREMVHPHFATQTANRWLNANEQQSLHVSWRSPLVAKAFSHLSDGNRVACFAPVSLLQHEGTTVSGVPSRMREAFGGLDPSRTHHAAVQLRMPLPHSCDLCALRATKNDTVNSICRLACATTMESSRSLDVGSLLSSVVMASSGAAPPLHGGPPDVRWRHLGTGHLLIHSRIRRAVSSGNDTETTLQQDATPVTSGNDVHALMSLLDASDPIIARAVRKVCVYLDDDAAAPNSTDAATNAHHHMWGDSLLQRVNVTGMEAASSGETTESLCVKLHFSHPLQTLDEMAAIERCIAESVRSGHDGVQVHVAWPAARHRSPGVDRAVACLFNPSTSVGYVHALRRMHRGTRDAAFLPPALAHLAGSVYFMEWVPPAFTTNRYSRGRLQSGVAFDEPFGRDLKLLGEDHVVGAADSGIDHDHCFFSDPKTSLQPNVFNPAHRKIVRYRTLTGSSSDRGIGPFGDSVPGHGTHVCGSLAGSVDAAGPDAASKAATYAGMAPLSKITFFDLQSSTSGDALNIPPDLRDVFAVARGDGARVHSNSWGSGASEYSGQSQEADDYIAANPDMLLVFAAGNEADKACERNPKDVRCDRFTVISPSTCKNGLSIGAAMSVLESWQEAAHGNFVMTVSGSPQRLVAVRADFGLRDPVLRDVELVQGNPDGACSDLQEPQNLVASSSSFYKGKAVLVKRGTCFFTSKARRVLQRGGIAIVVINNIPGDPIIMGTESEDGQDAAGLGSIAGFMVTDIDGARLWSAASASSPALRVNISQTAEADPHKDPENLSSFSSHGPTRDFRFKPDIIGVGEMVHSARSDANLGSNNCDLWPTQGTSMATPLISGTAVLIQEYFKRGFYPHGFAASGPAVYLRSDTLKAILVHSAMPLTKLFDRNTQGDWRPLGATPSFEQGFGIVRLNHTLPVGAQSPVELAVRQDAAAIVSSTSHEQTYCVRFVRTPETPIFRSVLAWIDPPSTPAAEFHLINNLDLSVVTPDGRTLRGNTPVSPADLTSAISGGGGLDATAGGLNASSADWWQWRGGMSHVLDDESTDCVNNVEKVVDPQSITGSYLVRVTGASITTGTSQRFALVSSGTEVSGNACALHCVAPLGEDPGAVCSGRGKCDDGVCMCEGGYHGTFCEDVLPVLMPSTVARPSSLATSPVVSDRVQPGGWKYFLLPLTLLSAAQSGGASSPSQAQGCPVSGGAPTQATFADVTVTMTSMAADGDPDLYVAVGAERPTLRTKSTTSLVGMPPGVIARDTACDNCDAAMPRPPRALSLKVSQAGLESAAVPNGQMSFTARLVSAVVGVAGMCCFEAPFTLQATVGCQPAAVATPPMPSSASQEAVVSLATLLYFVPVLRVSIILPLATSGTPVASSSDRVQLYGMSNLEAAFSLHSVLPAQPLPLDAVLRVSPAFPNDKATTAVQFTFEWPMDVRSTNPTESSSGHLGRSLSAWIGTFDQGGSTVSREFVPCHDGRGDPSFVTGLAPKIGLDGVTVIRGRFSCGVSLGELQSVCLAASAMQRTVVQPPVAKAAFDAIAPLNNEPRRTDVPLTFRFALSDAAATSGMPPAQWHASVVRISCGDLLLPRASESSNQTNVPLLSAAATKQPTIAPIVATSGSIRTVVKVASPGDTTGVDAVAAFESYAGPGDVDGRTNGRWTRTLSMPRSTLIKEGPPISVASTEQKRQESVMSSLTDAFRRIRLQFNRTAMTQALTKAAAQRSPVTSLAQGDVWSAQFVKSENNLTAAGLSIYFASSGASDTDAVPPDDSGLQCVGVTLYRRSLPLAPTPISAGAAAASQSAANATAPATGVGEGDVVVASCTVNRIAAAQLDPVPTYHLRVSFLFLSTTATTTGAEASSELVTFIDRNCVLNVMEKFSVKSMSNRVAWPLSGSDGTGFDFLSQVEFEGRLVAAPVEFQGADLLDFDATVHGSVVAFFGSVLRSPENPMEKPNVTIAVARALSKMQLCLYTADVLPDGSGDFRIGNLLPATCGVVSWSASALGRSFPPFSQLGCGRTTTAGWHIKSLASAVALFGDSGGLRQAVWWDKFRETARAGYERQLPSDLQSTAVVSDWLAPIWDQATVRVACPGRVTGIGAPSAVGGDFPLEGDHVVVLADDTAPKATLSIIGTFGFPPRAITLRQLMVANVGTPPPDVDCPLLNWDGIEGQVTCTITTADIVPNELYAVRVQLGCNDCGNTSHSGTIASTSVWVLDDVNGTAKEIVRPLGVLRASKWWWSTNASRAAVTAAIGSTMSVDSTTTTTIRVSFPDDRPVRDTSSMTFAPPQRSAAMDDACRSSTVSPRPLLPEERAAARVAGTNWPPTLLFWDVVVKPGQSATPATAGAFRGMRSSAAVDDVIAGFIDSIVPEGVSVPANWTIPSWLADETSTHSDTANTSKLPDTSPASTRWTATAACTATSMDSTSLSCDVPTSGLQRARSLSTDHSLTLFMVLRVMGQPSPIVTFAVPSGNLARTSPNGTLPVEGAATSYVQVASLGPTGMGGVNRSAYVSIFPASFRALGNASDSTTADTTIHVELVVLSVTGAPPTNSLVDRMLLDPCSLLRRRGANHTWMIDGPDTFFADGTGPARVTIRAASKHTITLREFSEAARSAAFLPLEGSVQMKAASDSPEQYLFCLLAETPSPSQATPDPPGCEGYRSHFTLSGGMLFQPHWVSLAGSSTAAAAAGRESVVPITLTSFTVRSIAWRRDFSREASLIDVLQLVASFAANETQMQSSADATFPSPWWNVKQGDVASLPTSARLYVRAQIARPAAGEGIATSQRTKTRVVAGISLDQACRQFEVPLDIQPGEAWDGSRVSTTATQFFTDEIQLQSARRELPEQSVAVLRDSHASLFELHVSVPMLTEDRNGTVGYLCVAFVDGVRTSAGAQGSARTVVPVTSPFYPIATFRRSDCVTISADCWVMQPKSIGTGGATSPPSPFCAAVTAPAQCACAFNAGARCQSACPAGPTGMGCSTGSCALPHTSEGNAGGYQAQSQCVCPPGRLGETCNIDVDTLPNITVSDLDIASGDLASTAVSIAVAPSVSSGVPLPDPTWIKINLPLLWLRNSTDHAATVTVCIDLPWAHVAAAASQSASLLSEASLRTWSLNLDLWSPSVGVVVGDVARSFKRFSTANVQQPTILSAAETTTVRLLAEFPVAEIEPRSNDSVIASVTVASTPPLAARADSSVAVLPRVNLMVTVGISVPGRPATMPDWAMTDASTVAPGVRPGTRLDRPRFDPRAVTTSFPRVVTTECGGSCVAVLAATAILGLLIGVPIGLAVASRLMARLSPRRSIDSDVEHPPGSRLPSPQSVKPSPRRHLKPVVAVEEAAVQEI